MKNNVCTNNIYSLKKTKEKGNYYYLFLFALYVIKEDDYNNNIFLYILCVIGLYKSMK